MFKFFPSENEIKYVNWSMVRKLFNQGDNVNSDFHELMQDYADQEQDQRKQASSIAASLDVPRCSGGV